MDMKWEQFIHVGTLNKQNKKLGKYSIPIQRGKNLTLNMGTRAKTACVIEQVVQPSFNE